MVLLAHRLMGNDKALFSSMWMAWPVSSMKKSPLVAHPRAKSTLRGGSSSMHFENAAVVPEMGVEVAKAGA